MIEKVGIVEMDIERLHNELAMRLGYERIVKDKRITISVEESDNPCVILTLNPSDAVCMIMKTYDDRY